MIIWIKNVNNVKITNIQPEGIDNPTPRDLQAMIPGQRSQMNSQMTSPHHQPQRG